jgi:hypothetical protein
LRVFVIIVFTNSAFDVHASIWTKIVSLASKCRLGGHKNLVSSQVEALAEPLRIPLDRKKYPNIYIQKVRVGAELKSNVRLSQDELSSDPIILKTPRSANDPRDIHILNKERENLLHLQKDPNAKRFFPKVIEDSNYDPKNPELKKEFVEGTEVFNYGKYDDVGYFITLSKSPNMTDEAKLSAWSSFGHDILDLVDVLRKNDLVFGDLQGRNLMISKDGQLKLFDIGGASKLSSPKKDEMDIHGGSFGSAQYPDKPGEWTMALDAVFIMRKTLAHSLGVVNNSQWRYSDYGLKPEQIALLNAFDAEVYRPMNSLAKQNEGEAATILHAQKLFSDFLAKYQKIEE